MFERKEDVFNHRGFIQEVEVLENHPDGPPFFLQFLVGQLLLVVLEEDVAVNGHSAISRLLQEVDSPHEGRFPGPGVADDTVNIALFD